MIIIEASIKQLPHMETTMIRRGPYLQRWELARLLSSHQLGRPAALGVLADLLPENSEISEIWWAFRFT